MRFFARSVFMIENTATHQARDSSEALLTRAARVNPAENVSALPILDGLKYRTIVFDVRQIRYFKWGRAL